MKTSTIQIADNDAYKFRRPIAVKLQEAPTLSIKETKAALEAFCLRYFVENTGPWGTLDRVNQANPQRRDGNYDSISTATTGFGVAVLSNAAERGLIDRKKT